MSQKSVDGVIWTTPSTAFCDIAVVPAKCCLYSTNPCKFVYMEQNCQRQLTHDSFDWVFI